MQNCGRCGALMPDGTCKRCVREDARPRTIAEKFDQLLQGRRDERRKVAEGIRTAVARWTGDVTKIVDLYETESTLAVEERAYSRLLDDGEFVPEHGPKAEQAALDLLTLCNEPDSRIRDALRRVPELSPLLAEAGKPSRILDVAPAPTPAAPAAAPVPELPPTAPSDEDADEPAQDAPEGRFPRVARRALIAPIVLVGGLRRDKQLRWLAQAVGINADGKDSRIEWVETRGTGDGFTKGISLRLQRGGIGVLLLADSLCGVTGSTTLRRYAQQHDIPAEFVGTAGTGRLDKALRAVEAKLSEGDR